MGAIKVTTDDKFATEVEVDYSGVDIDDLLGLNEHEDLIEIKNVEIEWSIDLTVRSWGIKDLVIIVPDQVIEFDYGVDRYDKDEDDYYSAEQTKTVYLKNIKVELDSEIDFNSSIAPKTLEYFKGQWKLIF